MRNRTLGKLLVWIGILCFVLAIGLAGYNIWDAERASETVEKTVEEIGALLPDTVVPAEVFSPENLPNLEMEAPETEVPYYVLNPEIEMLEEVIDGVAYIGILEIPALELTLPVISRWSTANGRIAPCRYAGSAYTDDLVVCAHNYTSHFGRLSSLSLGEEVLLTDMEGNQFTYRIQEIEVLDGTAIQQMCAGNWDLTLFTCTIGGASRVTVRCEKIRE